MPSPLTLLKWLKANVGKSQAELNALQEAAARRFELEAAARARFSQPDVPTDLQLKHGSPFKFEDFDFEGNLRKGEGALAFGPGGYLTGNTPLAKQYARKLYEAKNKAPRGHLPMREALTVDSEAAAEYLRALNVGKVLRAVPEPEAIPITRTAYAGGLSPRLEARLGAPNIETRFGPQYGFKTVTSLSDFTPYTQALLRAGLDPKELPTRIGRGGVSPDEAVRMGREMRSALEEAPGLRPRITDRIEPIDRSFADLNEFYQYQPEGLVYRPYLPGQSKLRQNLNSTYRAVEGKPGSTSYSPSMFTRVDLRDPMAGFDPDNELARRLYTTPLNASLADLVPYDFPLNAASPELVGRLASLAEKYGVLDKLTPETTGADALSTIYKGVGGGALEQMRALKEAGVPGHFFLRGGRRDGLPESINPDDFNFVIFDQGVLGKPDVTEFSAGGAVHHA